ncbi:hypothetical protein [Olleya sp. ITB9]|uniref:hypothetical protein n=1 Tax=Olleya sp. ITB9 TaxID=1715648 RepID=UPI00048F1FEE|nr:hypothetical protein [Olleya sp. ITB9]
MKQRVWIILFVVLTSCNSKTETPVKAKKVYDMYVPSEMSKLMLDMYAHNLELKQQIINGQSPTQFPNHFLNIHSAQLSDFQIRDQQFKSFSNLFITAQKEIYNTTSTLNLKDRFNNTINTCIACHSKICTGPIPKIKKLLIK